MDSLPDFVTHGAPLRALRARELRYYYAQSRQLNQAFSENSWSCSGMSPAEQVQNAPHVVPRFRGVHAKHSGAPIPKGCL